MTTRFSAFESPLPAHPETRNKISNPTVILRWMVIIMAATITDRKREKELLSRKHEGTKTRKRNRTTTASCTGVMEEWNVGLPVESANRQNSSFQYSKPP
jgi:hypothetical protein